MHCEIGLLRAIAGALRARLESFQRAGDAGYTTETVVVIALLIVAALTAVGLITAKIIAKAGSLNLG